MAFTEPLADLFRTADFAIVATYGGQPVNVIFDNEYIDVLGAGSTSPAAIAKSADVPGIANGATLTISGSDYTVRDVQPDGLGVVVLILEAP